MERVEVYMRTQLACLLAEHTGPFGFSDPNNLPRLDEERHERFMDKRRDAYNRARNGEPFAKHFHDKYGDACDLPPYRMLVNVLGFGMVVTLFKGSPVAVREQIADELGVSTKVLDSWLVTINTVRNYRNGRSSDLGTISQCWEVDPNRYSSDSARPWHSSRTQVKRVVFDSDFSGTGMTNFAYW